MNRDDGYLDRTPLEFATELWDWGFNPVPAAYGSKIPSIPWKPYIDRRVTLEELERWFGRLTRTNYWSPTGLVSRVAVVDCDNAYSIEWWRDRIGEPLDRTACVKTARGMHFFFRIEHPMASWSQHDGRLEFDVRADGTGIILPPSVHISGADYGWGVEPGS